MKKRYVKERDWVIDQIMNNTRMIYSDDRDMMNHAMDLCVHLQVSEPDQEFVDGLRGFIFWSSDHADKVSQGSALSTLLHDLNEFKNEGHEAWFCPRTSMYKKYLTGASNV